MISKGSFVTDGILFGIVLNKTLLACGKRALDAYIVDVGGGRTSVFIASQTRLVD